MHPSLSSLGPVRICPTITLRQSKEDSDPPIPPVTDWFCVVDRSPAMAEEQWALADGSVVLTLSATQADAVAVADLAGIGIVRYAHLSDSDQAALRRHLAPYRQVDG